MGTIFDWGIFGVLVRCFRRELGFRKAEEFSDAIEQETGLKISADIIYKIENGKQKATVEQFFAILSMFDTGSRKRIIRLCVCDGMSEVVAC